MPFDEVNDPQRVQSIWFGGSMSDNAKSGLRELGQRFPESEKVLWVLPRRRPGETGRLESEALMAEYRQEAENNGFKVRHAYDEAEWLAGNLDPSKYNAQTLRDIYNLEMSNQGYIAAKDMTAMLIGSRETSLTLDLSHRHMLTDELNAVENHPKYNADAAWPLKYNEAELKVIDLSHGENRLMRDMMQADGLPFGQKFSQADLEPSMSPHLDVNAMYSRAGTKGQEAMKAGAEAWISYYSTLVSMSEKGGHITLASNSDTYSVKPETINIGRPAFDKDYQRERDNWLSAKFNTQDPDREMVIGYMAVNSINDGIHMVYGEPAYEADPDKPMPSRVVPEETWDQITMQAFDVNGVKVIPSLSVTKEAQNSWRVKDRPANAAALHEREKVDDVWQSKLPGEKMTLLHATNLGVEEAKKRNIATDLQQPVRMTFVDRRPTTTDNSPNQTPPRTASPDLQALRQDVANLQIPNTQGMAQNGPQTGPQPMARSNSAPTNSNTGGRAV